MENINNNILDININDNNLIIIYDNGTNEVINKNKEGYKLMHKSWLVTQPPFISDIYKKQMRDIILCSIANNIQCFNDLNMFFSNNNKENVIKFFNYMRKRDLTKSKAIWKPT